MIGRFELLSCKYDILSIQMSTSSDASMLEETYDRINCSSTIVSKIIYGKLYLDRLGSTLCY